MTILSHMKVVNHRLIWYGGGACGVNIGGGACGGCGGRLGGGIFGGGLGGGGATTRDVDTSAMTLMVGETDSTVTPSDSERAAAGWVMSLFAAAVTAAMEDIPTPPLLAPPPLAPPFALWGIMIRAFTLMEADDNCSMRKQAGS